MSLVFKVANKGPARQADEEYSGQGVTYPLSKRGMLGFGFPGRDEPVKEEWFTQTEEGPAVT